VDIVSPEPISLARVLGDKLGEFIRSLHEAHGVTFHLGHKPAKLAEKTVQLDDGRRLSCDFVVVGVGVTPRTELAVAAGLEVNNGIVTDDRLQSSSSDVYAAGDVAAYPDAWSGKRVRVEHWAVAQRQGQAAARAMVDVRGESEGEAGGSARDPGMDARGAYSDVPFFWSQHYDVTINYVGHAESWDHIVEQGDPQKGKYLAAFVSQGNVLAVATLGLDSLSLQIEAAMEAGDPARVAALINTPV